MSSGKFPAVVESWGVGGTANRPTLGVEHELEREVSLYIGALPFTVVDVPDEPGPESLRGTIERGAIALLSAAAPRQCVRAKDDWLGFSAGRLAIAESLLWNVKHVNETYDPTFLMMLADLA